MKAVMRKYLFRKLGKDQSWSYLLSAYFPALLILIVFTLLSFITIFVTSMALKTDRMIEVLGSGTIVVEGQIPESLVFPETVKVDTVKKGSALSYGESETALLSLKGVSASYFNSERESLLKLKGSLQEGRNIILSKTEAKTLDVSINDNIALMLFDSKSGRVRPVLCTVTGLFETGYGEFDESLAYVPLSLLEEDESVELLLGEKEDSTDLLRELSEQGLYATSFKVLYSSLLDNVKLSIDLLNFILLVIAFSAGFFALNIASEYVERDKNEIKSLYLLGLTNNEVFTIYRRLSVALTMISAFVGSLLGGILCRIFTLVLAKLDTVKYPVLSNYVTSFNLVIPYSNFLLFFVLVFVVSSLSLFFSLRSNRIK